MKKFMYLLFCISLVLSACTGTATTQAPTAPTAAPVAAEPTKVPAEPTKAPATIEPTKAPTPVPTAEPVTLRLSAWGSPEQNAPTADMVKAFMAKYPNITIEEEYDPFDGYWEKKTTQLASDQLPDVFAISTAYICDYAAAGRLADLTSYTSDPEITAFLTGLPANAMENLTLGGKVYGFPYAAGTIVLFYNKNMFDAAHVAYPQAGWTYKELLEAAAKLTADTNGDGEADRWGYYGEIYGLDTFYAVVHSFGGRWFSDDAKQSLANSPATVEAVQFIQDLIFKYKVSPRPQDIEGIDFPFASGLVAMKLGLVGEMGTYKEITDFKWDIAAPALGYKGQLAAGSIRGNPNFVVSAKSAHPKEAALLAAWMAGPEAQTILGAAKGRFPVNSAGQTKWLTAPPDNFKAIIDLMNNKVGNEPLCINHQSEITDAWNLILEGEILTNAQPAEKVLPALADQIQKLLDSK